ncbi:hypothetical protein D3C73_1563600 [compost metagenome]
MDIARFMKLILLPSFQRLGINEIHVILAVSIAQIGILNAFNPRNIRSKQDGFAVGGLEQMRRFRFDQIDPPAVVGGIHIA